MRSRAPFVVLLGVLSLLSRLPALVHPDTTNSDATIVGLQAMHLLRGEWSPLLWGSHYQTSVDSFVAAAFFAVLGPTMRALMLSALSLHIALNVMVFVMLDRVLDRGRAFALSLLLVFTGAAVHSYALYPPRQAALTVAFGALFTLDRAFAKADGKGDPRATLLVMAGALGSFSLFADPYALVLVPALLAGAAVWIATELHVQHRRIRAAAFVAAGVAAGAIPSWLLMRHPEWRHGEAGLSLDVLSRNARLLVEVCGPWAFGTAVYRPALVQNYAPWAAPLAARIVQVPGGLLLAGTVTLAPFVALRRDVPWPVKRFALLALAISGATFGGFLLSVMVMDHFSMRYLAAAILGAPFALAPLASRLRTRYVAALVAPMLGAGLIGAFASFGPVATGLSMPPLPGRDDERALVQELAALGVHEGRADYWVSYRLTFMTAEALVVVPTHTKQDRYAPYRTRTRAARVHAYIVDPYRSEEPADVVEARLRATGALKRTVRAGVMTAFIVDGPVPDDA